MVRNAQLGKEIVVTVMNRVGVLADMARILAEHGINVEAVAGYSTESEAKIMLVSNDNLRAMDALIKAGYKAAKENSVVILELENKPGSLKLVTQKLASEGIDLKYIYGTACASSCPAKLILSTNNDEKTLLAFKK